MAIQSIGARYVPKFYENPNGNSEWKANVEYEPLTIVTYNGNSFTSKKPVPSNIGEPNMNPEYWVSTGIYNAQIESYRVETQEALSNANEALDDISNIETDLTNLDSRVTDTEHGIDHLQNEIDDIHFDVDFAPLEKTAPNKKYIFLFDSFGASTVHEDIRTHLISKMNLNSNNAWLKGVSGTAFGKYDERGEGHTTYLDTIKTYPSNYSIAKKDITDIIIQTAGNDCNRILSSTQQGVTDFSEYCAANFPNARILVCFTLWSQNCSVQADRHTIMLTLKEILGNTPNMYFMEGVEISAKYLGDRTNDTHPGATVDGYFAESIKNAIITGTASKPYIHAARCYFVNDTGEVHFAADAGCQNYQAGDMVVMNFTGEERGTLNENEVVSSPSNQYTFSRNLGQMGFERFFNATYSLQRFYLHTTEVYITGKGWTNAQSSYLRLVSDGTNMNVHLYVTLENPEVGDVITHFRFKNESFFLPAYWC